MSPHMTVKIVLFRQSLIFMMASLLCESSYDSKDSLIQTEFDIYDGFSPV